MSSGLFLYLVLGSTGLFFIFTGLSSLTRPGVFANTLALTPNGHSGNIEIRAQYGGFFTAAAIPQFLALTGYIPMSFAFGLSLVIFGGLIVGRLLALMSNPEREAITPMIKALFWIDGIGTLCTLAGLLITTKTIAL